MNLNQQKKPYLYIMVALLATSVLALLFFFLIYRYEGFFSIINTLGDILAPFVYGGVLAYLLKPSVNFFDRLFHKFLPDYFHRIITGLSIFISFVVTGLCIYALFALMLPEFFSSISNVIATAPTAINDLVAKLRKLFEDYPMALDYINNAYASISASISSLSTSSIVPHISTFVGSVSLGVMSFFGTVLDVIVGIFVAIYLLGIRNKFGKQAKLVLYGLCKKNWADFILKEINYADRMFGGFINGKILDSIIIGIITYIVCLAVGFPNPTLISMIIGFTNVIPFFGPFIGAVPAAILILLSDPIKTIWFVIFILILQQFDGNILGPKILGDCTGLSSFWVLFSIIFFGGLWGFVGMIVGVPLFAVLYDILRQIVTHGLHKNHCRDMLLAYNQEFGNEPPSAVEQLMDTIDEVVEDVLEEDTAEAEPQEPADQSEKTIL